MNARILGYSGLHQGLTFKKRAFPYLAKEEYRILQGLDAAAALVVGPNIVAAAAEERFIREKTTGTFPVHALKFCLRQGGLALKEVDFVAHCFAYQEYENFFSAEELSRRQYEEVYSPDVQRRNLEEFFPGSELSAKFVAVPHHLAHAASAFFPSGFSEALILVSDGMGEFHSMTVAIGRGTHIDVVRQVPALHSIGVLYGIFALFLGFDFGVDEYKVMGLAPHGDQRRFFRAVFDFIQLKNDGTYAIPVFGSETEPVDRETHRGVLGELERVFGPRRKRTEEIGAREIDLAAAIQAVFQTCQLHVLRHFRRETGLENLCLAGGTALNCSANGVIKRSRLFKRMFVQPAAGDDGAALGAALHTAAKLSGKNFVPRRMELPLWGPDFSSDEIRALLAGRSDCDVQHLDDLSALCREVASRLSSGQVVGWFSGRMEFGPRALGNRSILADPRDPGMREKINALVKKRERFRPFAPIVQSEAASRYFDILPDEVEEFAHMLIVAPVRASERERLPAVTHVDGSARVQTVKRSENVRLWELLSAFEKSAGVPILLNTSFNVKGQPIVCTPTEALDTFLVAGLDGLVLGDFLVTPRQGATRESALLAAQNRIVLGVG